MRKVTHGCLAAGDEALMHCRSNDAIRHQAKHIHCCKQDWCNQEYSRQLPNLTAASPPDRPEQTAGGVGSIGLFAAGGLLLAGILVTVALQLLVRYWLRRRRRLRRPDDPHHSGKAVLSTPAARLPCRLLGLGRRGALRTVATHTCPCGQTHPPQRLSITRDIELLRPLLCSGRYGQLYHGRRKGIDVAVRVLPTDQLGGWLTERRVHQLPLLRHEHVVGFIAAECVQLASRRMHLLITDYHPFGSLQDFLRNRWLDDRLALRLMHTAARGLHYLHLNVLTKQCKQQVAHRDVRSRSFLVRADFTCVIANFRHAVEGEMLAGDSAETNAGWSNDELDEPSGCRSDRAYPGRAKRLGRSARKSARDRRLYDRESASAEVHERLMASEKRNEHHSASAGGDDLSEANLWTHQIQNDRLIEESKSGRIGLSEQASGALTCARYSAPELLSDQIDRDSLQSMKKADVYAFALVVWEISRRCSSGGFAETYEQPYFEHLRGQRDEPSQQQMHELVVVQRVRPALNPGWFKHERLQHALQPIVEFMWSENPLTRHSMLRVKNELGELAALL